jgi:hypothetical protein
MNNFDFDVKGCLFADIPLFLSENCPWLCPGKLFFFPWRGEMSSATWQKFKR